MPAIDTSIFQRHGTRSPNRVTAAIDALCSELSPGQALSFVDVRPDACHQPHECFHNVNEKVSRDGGAILYGWAIWEWQRVFIEAEHHAVWCNGGALLDVTPHVPTADRILFLPDPNRTYDYAGQRRVPNVKMAIGKSASIQPWIEASDRILAYIEASSVGKVARMDQDVAARLHGEAQRHHAGILVDLARTTGRNDPCFCRSGKKFKKCCSPLINLNV